MAAQIIDQYSKLVEQAERQPGVREVMELQRSCMEAMAIVRRAPTLESAMRIVSVSNSSNISTVSN